jgi:hypothetical protein
LGIDRRGLRSIRFYRFADAKGNNILEYLALTDR